MKKRKIVLTLVIFLGLLLLSGCRGYVSSYKAILLIRGNTAHSAFMEFNSLQGRMVFTLKEKKNSSGKMKAACKLTSGSAIVYYDDGLKKELFTIGAGEEVEESFGPFERSKIYILVETDGKCKEGAFHFEME